MTITQESGMQFGEYLDDQVFHLEQSAQYREGLLPNGIKSCEFLLRRDKKLYFVEAKTTCPKLLTAVSPADKREKYEEYVRDVVLKMRHSLALYYSILLGRYSKNGVPGLLAQTDMSDLQIVLLLVVKKAEKEWLIPLQELFYRKLKDEIRICKILRFCVINEETARAKQFIL